MAGTPKASASQHKFRLLWQKLSDRTLMDHYPSRAHLSWLWTLQWAGLSLRGPHASLASSRVAARVSLLPRAHIGPAHSRTCRNSGKRAGRGGEGAGVLHRGKQPSKAPR